MPHASDTNMNAVPKRKQQRNLFVRAVLWSALIAMCMVAGATISHALFIGTFPHPGLLFGMALGGGIPAFLHYMYKARRQTHNHVHRHQ